jgi:poly-beta-1,6-N-acetyl-D-glucosamine synthase
MLILTLILLLSPVVYCYVGYPLLMSMLAKFRPRPWKKDETYRPTVSVILAVYNEESVIRACVESFIAQDYPHEKLEILIGSDGSSDRTNAILRELEVKDPRVKPFPFVERRGKNAVVNDLVSASKGEILIFADADITHHPSSARAHVRHFVDESVACVSGYLKYVGADNNLAWNGENDYLTIESKLRLNEALIGTTVGIFGGNYSMRRSDFRTIPDAPICDELYSALQVVNRGKRTVFDPEAKSYESYARTIDDEFARKTRYAARGFNTVRFLPEFRSPFSNFTAFALWSHKLLRYVASFFILAAVLLAVVSQSVPGGSSLPLFNSLLGVGLFVLLVGYLLERSKRSLPVVSNIYWLAVMNIAFGLGTLKFILNRERKFWYQTTRPDAVPQPALTPKSKEAVQQ